MLIGLSYHGGDEDYEDYAKALHRRAEALRMDIETQWLAGAGREARLDVLEEIDAIVFTGGADVEPGRYGFADPHRLCNVKPDRDAVEWAILERLRQRRLRTLAICRGAQLLNVFYGGTLIPDLAERNALHCRIGDERREHGVSFAEGSRLYRLAGARGLVNSSHHQAVDRLAGGFRAVAHSDDGIIEAFEPAAPGDQPFVLAVQWHPEGMAHGEPLADRVLDAFLTEKH